jgi:dynein assembly factor 3
VKVAKWGLFSDILVGPYTAFGMDSDFKEMFEKANDMYKYVG